MMQDSVAVFLFQPRAARMRLKAACAGADSSTWSGGSAVIGGGGTGDFFFDIFLGLVLVVVVGGYEFYRYSQRP